jgi:hypothetical protein
MRPWLLCGDVWEERPDKLPADRIVRGKGVDFSWVAAGRGQQIKIWDRLEMRGSRWRRILVLLVSLGRAISDTQIGKTEVVHRVAEHGCGYYIVGV